MYFRDFYFWNFLSTRCHFLCIQNPFYIPWESTIKDDKSTERKKELNTQDYEYKRLTKVPRDCGNAFINEGYEMTHEIEENIISNKMQENIDKHINILEPNYKENKEIQDIERLLIVDPGMKLLCLGNLNRTQSTRTKDREWHKWENDRRVDK